MGGKITRVKKDKDALDNQRVPQRNHQYEEIDDEQLTANQERYNESKSGTDSQDLYDDASTASPVKPTTNARGHQYDEITTEDLISNRKAAKKTGNGAKAKDKGKSPKNQSKEEEEVTPDSEGAELYTNVGSNVMNSLNNSFDNELYEGQCDLEKDVYAQPMKKPKANQLKPSSPPQLNYIEVEFTQASSKPEVKTEVKRARSPVNYTNVINDNGKVVLLSES